MVACCARMVPRRGAGGGGDSVLPSWLGHGGFRAGGARWLPSRVVARSAFSFSLPTLPLLPPSLPLSAHPPAPTLPAPRFFFPHSFCLPPQICVVNCFPLSAFLQSAFNFQLSAFLQLVLHLLPQAVSALPGISSISHLSHNPFSRPATRWFRPRAVACEKAKAEMEKAESRNDKIKS
jgi:hypothetical protein